ncbi:MAG: nucleotidyl transferase AbiEii/AbiGii toxin family protein [Chloroflexota bacterium]
MKSIAKEAWGNDPIRRVHLVVAIDRLLVRLLETTSWGVWVLKGGYANQLRHPSEARFTEDVDVRIDADISGATPMVTDALTLHIEDPFEFELASPPRELVGPPGGGMRYPVIARLVGQELVRFKIDVSSRDAIVGDLERYPSDPIIKMLDLVPALFPVYPVAQQFAEKLHAYTLPRDVRAARRARLASDPPAAAKGLGSPVRRPPRRDGHRGRNDRRCIREALHVPRSGAPGRP